MNTEKMITILWRTLIAMLIVTFALGCGHINFGRYEIYRMIAYYGLRGILVCGVIVGLIIAGVAFKAIYDDLEEKKNEKEDSED